MVRLLGGQFKFGSVTIDALLAACCCIMNHSNIWWLKTYIYSSGGSVGRLGMVLGVSFGVSQAVVDGSWGYSYSGVLS